MRKVVSGLLISCNGSKPKVVSLGRNTYEILHTEQELVDGYITAFEVPCKECEEQGLILDAICNDEGLAMSLPVNHKFMGLLGRLLRGTGYKVTDLIVGNVILSCTNNKGVAVSIPEDVLSKLQSLV